MNSVNFYGHRSNVKIIMGKYWIHVVSAIASLSILVIPYQWKGGGGYRFPQRLSVSLSTVPIRLSLSPLGVRPLGFLNFSQSFFEILTWIFFNTMQVTMYICTVKHFVPGVPIIIHKYTQAALCLTFAWLFQMQTSRETYNRDQH